MPPRGWQAAIEAVFRRHAADALSSDPLQFPHRFADRADREVAAFLAASLAYGNVRSVCASLELVFRWTGARPARFVRTLDREEALARLGRFRHRWTSAEDLVSLGLILRRILERFGSVEALFAAGVVRDRAAEPHRVRVGGRRGDCGSAALALAPDGVVPAPGRRGRPGVRYFFPSPKTSAAKRPAMFLRWMVRSGDGLDLGLWEVLHPRDLVVPLDTHLFRIARRLRLTRRRTPAWGAALDLTRALAQLDPEDPTRYDFALSRLGIVEGCPRHPRSAPCELCELLRPPAGRSRSPGS